MSVFLGGEGCTEIPPKLSQKDDFRDRNLLFRGEKWKFLLQIRALCKVIKGGDLFQNTLFFGCEMLKMCIPDFDNAPKQNKL